MNFLRPFALLLFCTFLGATDPLATMLHAEAPTPAASAAYDQALARLEERLAQQHRSPLSYLAGLDNPYFRTRLRQGQPAIEPLNAEQNLPGAMLHHWRGTAFVPGAHAADFEHLLRNFSIYPQIYAPQLLSARQLAHPQPERYQALLRLRQHHVLTVILDTEYTVDFSRLDATHGYSASLGRRIAEIADAGGPHEHALSASEQHGFLWRIDSFWSWVEQDGGLYIQIESLTLTRSIPHGLGWAVGPFVQSIPRESLDFTLRSTASALAQRR